jgi:hypothetical protein
VELIAKRQFLNKFEGLSTSQVEALRLRGTPYERRVEFYRTDDLQILGRCTTERAITCSPLAGPTPTRPPRPKGLPERKLVQQGVAEATDVMELDTWARPPTMRRNEPRWHVLGDRSFEASASSAQCRRGA